MCLCVFFPFTLDVKFVGRTSRGHTGGRSHRISHPPSFCGGCLNFSPRRIRPFLSLVDREVEFCILNDSIVLVLLGIYFFIFLFFSEKNPVYPDSNSRPNVPESYEVTSELPGLPGEFKCERDRFQ